MLLDRPRRLEHTSGYRCDHLAALLYSLSQWYRVGVNSEGPLDKYYLFNNPLLLIGRR